MNWQAGAAIATMISAVAIVASALFVVVQLRQARRDRYFTITSHLFELWQSPEFQEDQLFLLHKLAAQKWDDFVAGGRGERAERALYRVGGFYDRVGNLIQHGLINEDDILPTVGGSAIAVWTRIEPLVREARRREDNFLFQNFESVLPTCRECYVPLPAEAEADTIAAAAFARSAPLPRPTPLNGGGVWHRIWFSRAVSFMHPWTRRVAPVDAKRLLDEDRALILDVTSKSLPLSIRGAVRPSPRDLSGWLKAVQADKDVVTYCT